jgi:hypothetical protein
VSPAKSRSDVANEIVTEGLLEQRLLPWILEAATAKYLSEVVSNDTSASSIPRFLAYSTTLIRH